MEKLKDISCILCKKGMSLRIKGVQHKSYVQSNRSYGAECWVIQVEDEKNG